MPAAWRYLCLLLGDLYSPRCTWLLMDMLLMAPELDTYGRVESVCEPPHKNYLLASDVLSSSLCQQANQLINAMDRLNGGGYVTTACCRTSRQEVDTHRRMCIRWMHVMCWRQWVAVGQ